MLQDLKEIILKSANRFEFWIEFSNHNSLRSFGELGVYKGEFAQKILKNCLSIESYYMIDSWKNLEDWNKPANTSNEEFEKIYQETLLRTDDYQEKRKILRGKTTEVINEIPDRSIDIMYIDGDHTLKGITIDLINSWLKTSDNGYIGGDDFCSNIWQHDIQFEPTLVFPFAVYFAEAMNVKIFSLPFNQFLIAKGLHEFEFIDLSKADYSKTNLLDQIQTLKKDEKNKSKNIFSKFFK